MGFLVARTHVCLSFRCFLKGEIPTFWPQAVVNNITFAVFECLKKKMCARFHAPSHLHIQPVSPPLEQCALEQTWKIST